MQNHLRSISLSSGVEDQTFHTTIITTSSPVSSIGAAAFSWVRGHFGPGGGRRKTVKNHFEALSASNDLT